MDESYSNQKIRLISGESVYKEQAELVGFCHNSQHPGFLIKSIVKRKQCLEKKCSHFEPFPDLPFWTAQEKKAQSKAEQKEEKKRSKLEQKSTSGTNPVAFAGGHGLCKLVDRSV